MSGGVPAGWVLVPVEPTHEMVEAVWKATLGGSMLAAERAARAMLSAVPTPPIEGRDADVERVARALYEEDDPWHQAWPWPDLNPEAQGGAATADTYRRLARAALQALGERG